MRGFRTAGGGSFRMAAMTGAIATFALAGATFAIAAPSGTGGPNPGGKTTSGGHSSCYPEDQSFGTAYCSHNPTEITKPCTTGGGNGCHLLNETPCDRGQSGVQLHNKHCGPSSLTSTPPPTITTPTGGPPTTPTGGPPATPTGGPPATPTGSPPAGGTSGTKGKTVGSRGRHRHAGGPSSVSGATSGKESSTPNATAAEAVTRTAAFTG